MNEDNIVDLFKAGHSIKYILKKAKASDKLFNSPNSETVILKHIEEAILKYWKEMGK